MLPGDSCHSISTMLANCEENVTQLHTMLDQEDQGTAPEMAGGKRPIKARMVKKDKGYNRNNHGPNAQNNVNVKEALCRDCGEIGHLYIKHAYHFPTAEMRPRLVRWKGGLNGMDAQDGQSVNQGDGHQSGNWNGAW